MSGSTVKRLCPVCNEPGTKICAGCSSVGYCTKEHQKDHWKIHKQTCAQKHKLVSSGSSSSSSTAASHPPEADVAVTWADQQRINQFSRLNTQLQRLEDDLKVKKSELANLIDAASEVEAVLDDDSCKIKVGEVYMSVDNDSAESYVTTVKKTTEAEIKVLESQQLKLKSDMNELKSILYGKFGKAINLENSEQTINN